MADTGAISPGTMADDATVGTVAWTNPDNAKVSDNNWAELEGFYEYTHYLKATNFGFSIPTGATINGILVEYQKFSGVELATIDSEVKIVKSNGSIGTTNRADLVNPWIASGNPTSYTSYGSSSDLWGETWEYTDINDVDFGVVISALVGINDPDFNDIADVDHIRITVYYTESGGATAVKDIISSGIIAFPR